MRQKLLLLLTPLVFFGFLSCFLIGGIVLDDHDYSITEARSLTQRPSIDLSDLSALSTQWEDYAIDQFPLRERLLKLYSAANLALGKVYLREAYVSTDGWLTSYVYSADAQARDALADALEQTVASLPSVRFVYAVTPQKNDMLSDSAAPYQDGQNSSANKSALLDALGKIDGLDVIDIGSYFTDSFSVDERESFYYRTDFHWNDLGAFRAAEYIAVSLGDGAVPSDADFLWRDLGQTSNYLGDLNRRFSYLLSTREDIPFYAPQSTEAIEYYLSGDALAERESIIARGVDTDASLNYNTVSTDNLGYLRIYNPDAPIDKCVLILKDSLENPMTDYFSVYYRQIIVIDPRAYNEPYSLAELTEQYGIDLVLLVYHQNNISTELTQFLLS